MDQQATQAARGRSPSAGYHQPGIRRSASPSPHPYQSSEANIGLGLDLDPSANQQFPTAAGDFNNFNQSNSYLNPQQQQDFSQSGVPGSSPFEGTQSFTPQTQPAYAQNLSTPDFNVGGDFSLFPPATSGGQFNEQPLFVGDIASSTDIGTMASQTHHSPTPPHMLKPEPHQPSSAHHSPSFNQHQFSSPPGRHSRHASLGPEAALMPNQLDWNQAQFQGHRRTPSEYSDVSSAAPSPNLPAQDSFENIGHGHSPMQRPQDPSFYSDVMGPIGNFSISDPQLSSQGRSPSHSPAISPRILPQQMPDMHQPNMMLGTQSAGFASAPPGAYGMPGPEAFPNLSHDNGSHPQMAPPAINIDFAPPGRQNSFGPAKQSLDQASLTPPDRGRPRSRPRAVTDPFNSGGAILQRPQQAGSLSPNLGADLHARSDSSSRSLSPLDRSGSANAQSRRRQSMSSVPNNVIALRLADPEYTNPQESGNSKRVQKHPATFQCTLCPKRFTRAYNLRSHLRTHTDERPFVCTVCGKAFARQHDRKRHEGLHSGEKKFVCKGELKAGGQWGCGRRFARADALGRHFRSEAGRICIKPLLDEEILERQRIWTEQHMAQSMAAQQQQAMALDPNGFPIDPNPNSFFPAALLAQYPALAQMTWNNDASNMEDELSGRSSFDASDYDEGDETGYVSGPGTGFGPGGMGEGYGEIGYASDYGGR